MRTRPRLRRLLLAGGAILVLVLCLYVDAPWPTWFRDSRNDDFEFLRQKFGSGSLPPRNDSKLAAKVGVNDPRYWRSHFELPRRVSQAKHKEMIEMLRDVDEALYRWNITYLMVGGTLLGSYFHHDMVPWDDDLDIAVDLFKARLVPDVLKSLGAKYEFGFMENHQWIKMYPANGRKFDQWWWKWPCLDIFFFLSNGPKDYWFELDSPYATVEMTSVFPLALRPFGNLWLPAPRDVQLFLYYTIGVEYGNRSCASRGYDHIIEKVTPYVELPCSKLLNTYPFVTKRLSSLNGSERCIEQLQLGNDTLQEMTILGLC